MFSSKYFIYLDTKAVGAATQIVNFFDNQVFNATDVIILVKKYKHKSAKKIRDIFNKAGLRFVFIRMSDIDLLTEGTIFYPFNTQSNSRIVANRKLKHIFITHGESNKISSVKPIIRIYDYVITAGQAGIDRYLQHKIFSQYDIDTGRVITLGNTFIGKTGLSTDKTGQKAIFYAPTWEGGVEQENYSSLKNIELVVQSLQKASELYNTSHIVIRPHPNTGHRKPEYIQNLIEISKLLQAKNIQVSLFNSQISLSFLQKIGLKRKGIKLVDKLNIFYSEIGFCDISAMETQFLNEDISYYLFCLSNNINTATDKLAFNIIYSNAFTFIDLRDYSNHFQDLKRYTIDQNFNQINLSHRIYYLIDNKIQ